MQGLFSGNPDNKFQVDAIGLSRLQVEMIADGMQSKAGNELAGLDGRTQLLMRLGTALKQKSEFFGEDARPGNMIGTSIYLCGTKHC